MRINRIASFLAAAVLLASQAGAAKHDIRWVLAHDPSVAADKSARDFAARIEKETGGEVRVEVITSDAYNKKAGKVVSHRELTTHLAEGKIEMTQMYTAGLARFNDKLRAISSPYLFRDYEHAEAVFEGALGSEFIAAVPPASGIRALGMTYSGGYGVFAMKDRDVRKPADMRGLKLLTDQFPLLGSYVSILGVEPICAPHEAFVSLSQQGFADALETTVARFDEYGADRGANVVVTTDHYLLTTMIVINEKFFQSLPAAHQATVRRLALESAREERALSVKANVEGRARLIKRGVKFIDLTTEEKKRFEAAFRPVYSLPWATEGQDWVSAIRATQVPTTSSRSGAPSGKLTTTN